MSGQRKNPQARDRTIGAQLKAVRVQQTALNLEAAAQAIGWSAATLSRTENGKRHITSEDVAVILTTYGVPAAQREELIESARSGVQAGWWARPLPGVLPDVGTLASHEASARAITTWSFSFIPGLLQTERYATGLMTDDGVAPEDAKLLWLARLRRQGVLPKVDYVAFLHESALYMSFGGVDAFREQLGHLAHASSQGRTVRIVRGRVPHRLLLHPWLLLHFSESAPILYVELYGSSVYLHDTEVHAYESMRSALDRVALSGAESRSMIERLRERL
ncbi:helix-turn-helix domain-containing protein [Actinokineospora spheciospongiae]|uniref:helix-turn-helix domain-containing protein n=1 Tax=Actinokineospora spheciospongiae TaxID=909613 RepID=UPI0004B884A1|nr:helix-turn-helix transcriptional regulator [Actinokineospora spheciospongiae]